MNTPTVPGTGSLPASSTPENKVAASFEAAPSFNSSLAPESLRLVLDRASVTLNGFRLSFPTSVESIARILGSEPRVDSGTYLWDQLGITAMQGGSLDSIGEITFWFDDKRGSKLPWGLKSEFKGMILVGDIVLDDRLLLNPEDLFAIKTRPPIRMFLGRCPCVMSGRMLATFGNAVAIKNLPSHEVFKQRYFWWFYQHCPYWLTQWFE